MKVFIAGATGALGRALVPQLVERGHEVVGMTRSASKQDVVRSLGARPVVADALDADAVAHELRRSAFAIAYRMLGSVSEAEDVVQEGLLRLHRARDGGERIESPRAYLSTVVSRLSLDYLRSARVRRETYVGEWLPEPLVASADDDPARKLEMADSWSLAFLVLLESLSPEQRAAFLLRDALLRGRRGGRSRRPRATVGPRRGAPRRRRRQGAGHQRALHGRAKVARTLIAGLRAGARLGGFTLRREEVNGQPGALVIDRDGRLAGVMVLDVADGQIQAVSSIVNPDKLQHLGPLADLRALRRERS